MKRQVLSILVENTAGVTSRISGLFSRRGYNIDSFSSGVTADPRYTRITIVASGDEQILEQIEQKIVTGEYETGSRIPSVRELAAEASVNPNTMQRAMSSAINFFMFVLLKIFIPDAECLRPAAHKSQAPLHFETKCKKQSPVFRASLLSFICRHEYNFNTLYIFSVFVSIQQFGNWLKFPAKNHGARRLKLYISDT